MGGEYNVNYTSTSPAVDALEVQLYDPVTDKWTILPTPTGWTVIGDGASTVLADGRVLFGNAGNNQMVIFDPLTQAYFFTSAKKDASFEETLTLLPNGDVVTAQCSNGTSSELYTPSTDTWLQMGSTGVTLPQACPGFVAEIGPAILLPNGNVFAIGATGNTAIYTPGAAGVAGTWSNGPTLVDSSNNTLFPMDAPACLMTNGQVLPHGESDQPVQLSGADHILLLRSVDQQGDDHARPVEQQHRLLPGPLAPVAVGRGAVLESVKYGRDSPRGRRRAGGLGSDHHQLPECVDPGPHVPDLRHPVQWPVAGMQLRRRRPDGHQLPDRASAGQQRQRLLPAHREPLHDGCRYRRGDAGQHLRSRSHQHSRRPVQPVCRRQRYCLRAFAVSVGTQDCVIRLEMSNFTIGEVTAQQGLTGNGNFDNALYVEVEGFSQSTIGSAVPSIAPPIGGLKYVSTGPGSPNDPTVPANQPQRFTFPFQAQFSNTGMFTAADQTLVVTAKFTAGGKTVTNDAQIVLQETPNPSHVPRRQRCRCRVVSQRRHQSLSDQSRTKMFGLTAGQGTSPQDGATTWIQKTIDNLNADAALGPVFDGLPSDEDTASLNLLQTDTSGNNIYNFALARVRYQDSQVASNVGVFFRLFAAQAIATTYDPASTYFSYKSGSTVVPVLGVQGRDRDDTVLRAPRVDVSQPLSGQPDPRTSAPSTLTRWAPWSIRTTDAGWTSTNLTTCGSQTGWWGTRRPATNSGHTAASTTWCRFFSWCAASTSASSAKYLSLPIRLPPAPTPPTPTSWRSATWRLCLRRTPASTRLGLSRRRSS